MFKAHEMDYLCFKSLKIHTIGLNNFASVDRLWSASSMRVIEQSMIKSTVPLTRAHLS